MTAAKPNVIFVIGPPGSGKGTQCQRIAKDYNYVHLSVGDLLREETEKSDSSLGKEITDRMKDGSLISAEIVCKLIENAIRKSEKKHFLLDGFPRDQDNVNEWRKTMSDKYYVQCVLVFDCDERTSIDRCLERGKQSGRKDDNEESLNLRIVTYNQSTRPIIELYEEKNLVQHIDASKDVDKIFEDVQNAMKNLK